MWCIVWEKKMCLVLQCCILSSILICGSTELHINMSGILETLLQANIETFPRVKTFILENAPTFPRNMQITNGHQFLDDIIEN